MEATINQPGGDQSYHTGQDTGKSELMQFFEKQVSDIYWAHRDLLRAIFESTEEE